MRKLVVAVLVLSALAIPVPAQAGVPEGYTVIERQKTAYAFVEETRADGSYGRTSVRAGWGYDTIDISWVGLTYVPDNPAVCSRMYFEASTYKGEPFDPTTDSSSYFQKRLQRARFDAFYSWGRGAAGTCPSGSHVAIMHFRWEGYGPATVQTYAEGAEWATSWTRQAHVTGQLYIDGVAVAGGDVSLGTGRLQRYVEAADCTADPDHWGCP